MGTWRFPSRCGHTSMDKLRSKVVIFFGRLLKVLMGAIVIPLAISLVGSLRDYLFIDNASGGTFLEWIDRGFLAYLGIHILLYRPVKLFRISHSLFATIAVWLFGSQVSSVERPTAGGGGKGKAARGFSEAGGGDGSTLVAFSPYAVPLPTILVCFLGWFAARWVDRAYMEGLVSFLIGVTVAFHWIMTADELQQQRKRWHIETYLLAIGLVFVITVVLGAACLPLVVPDFSFIQWLGDALHRAQVVYATTVEKLFGV